MGKIGTKLWMTLNSASSRSLKFHIIYFENGDRYGDEVNGSRIGNYPFQASSPFINTAINETAYTTRPQLPISSVLWFQTVIAMHTS